MTPAAPPASRWPTRIAWVCLVVSVLCVAVSAAMDVVLFKTAIDVTSATRALGLGLSLIGVLGMRTQANNRCVWLLVVIGLLPQLVSLVERLVALLRMWPTLPLPGVVVWLSYWLWWPMLTLPLLVLPLVFPNGRLPGRHWRIPALVTTVCIVGNAFLMAFGSTPDANTDSVWLPRNPYLIPALAPLAQYTFQSLFLAIYGVPMLIGLVALIARFRTGDLGVKRQLRWFLLPLPVTLSLMLYSFTVNEVVSRLGELMQLLGFGLMVGGIGIAILRGKLWDIDIVIRRTLIYGALTLLLGALYVALITALQQGLVALTGRGDSQLVTVASTLAVAGAFLPLRNRVQAFVDRRFFRRKFDAELVAARFAEDMRNAVDMDEIATKLCDVVEETMQPHKTVLWLPGRERKNT